MYCLNISEKDILNFLLKQNNINQDDVLNQLQMSKKKEILEQHPYKLFYSESDQRWHTYVPDETRPNGRKPIAKKKKIDLENALVDYYTGDTKVSEKELRENISLQKLYEEWMLYRRDHTATSPKTLQENANDWKKFFNDTELSKTAVKKIKPVTITRFFRNLTKDRKYTYKSISNARSVLNGIMYYAIEEEIIQHNPVSDVNFKQFPYKAVDNSTDVFTSEDVTKLLQYLEPIEEVYSLAIQLDFYLFIRIGELKALRWDSIDWEQNTIYLHEQGLNERQLNDDLTFSSREVHIVSQMKGHTSNGFRVEYLTPAAIAILKKAKKLNPDGEYIFMPDGHLLSTDRFNRRLKAYCLDCGVEYHSSHKIRFYNASTAYDGKNLTTISKLMGHSQVATTLHYLRNVDDGSEKRAAFNNLGLKKQKKDMDEAV